MKINELAGKARRLSPGRIMTFTGFSRSQLHQWRRGEQLDRKERAHKAIPEETVENVARTVIDFPHLSGRKGQAYLVYHRLGCVGMKFYERIKTITGRLLGQEVSRRGALPGRVSYEHVRPTKVGEIWSEDFTDVVVAGCRFKVASLMDNFSTYILGVAVAVRATAGLVGKPVEQALEKTGGQGPEKFLLSDNGSQYISEEHGEMLTSTEIVHRRIPACVPQYNGTIEGNMVDLKSVFYNVWERWDRKGTDKEKSLLEQVEAVVSETVAIINEALPRPALGGVTPADVQYGRREEVKAELQSYREQEESRRDVPPWTRSLWEIVKSGLGLDKMADGELLTKLAFFYRKPLRRIAQRHQESVG